MHNWWRGMIMALAVGLLTRLTALVGGEVMGIILLPVWMGLGLIALFQGLPTVWQLRHPRQAWWMAHTGKRVLAEEVAYEAELRKAISEAKRAQWKARVGDAPPIVVNYRSSFGAIPVMPDLFEVGSPDPISASEDRAEAMRDEDHYPPLGTEVYIAPSRNAESFQIGVEMHHGTLVAKEPLPIVLCEDGHYRDALWPDILWGDKSPKYFTNL